jgi:LmbE family N-acetylglucosaminyl deacetylase
MQFSHPKGHLYLPDQAELPAALQRTTHLGVGAHPDDLEFMGWHPILQCLHSPDFRFSGVIASDGRSSPRAGLYGHYSDEEMVEARLLEQRNAASTGDYAALFSLMHEETGPVMGGQDPARLVEDLCQVLRLTRPQVVLTHNLCDRHPHHVVVVLAVVEALRKMGPDYYPEEFYGGETWRGLDWMNPSDRLAFDVSEHQNLTAALMGIFDSQITGGKRYDLATAGRKRANATYSDPLTTDQSSSLEYAMDLMPLLRDPKLEPVDYASGLIDHFLQDVRQRLTSGGKA